MTTLACGTLKTCDLSSGRVLLVGSKGQGVECSKELAEFVKSCSSFFPLEGHFRRAFTHGEDSAYLKDEMARRLPQLVEAGLVWTEKSFRALASKGQPVRREPLTRAGVLTRSRPDRLARCLSTLRNATEKENREWDLWVSDDSTDEDMAGRNRRIVDSLANDFFRTRYLGREEKAIRLDALKKCCPVDPVLLDFALGDPMDIGFAAGANRNWQMLTHLDRPFFSLDDDVIPAAHHLGPVIPTWRMGMKGQLMDIDFPPGLPSGPESPPIPWIGHVEQAVGLRFIDMVDKAQIEGCIPSFLSEQSWLGFAAWAVCPGFSGQSPVRHTDFWLNLRDKALRELQRRDAELPGLMRAGQLRIAAHQPTLTPSGNLPGMAFALDGSRPLPPFFPVYHGEDAVYSSLLESAKLSATAHLPFSLQHDPGPGVSMILPGDDHPSARHVWPEVHLFLRLWQEKLPTLPPGEDPDYDGHWGRMGRHVSQLGLLHPSEFLDFLRSIHLDQSNRNMQLLHYLQALHTSKQKNHLRMLDELIQRQEKWLITEGESFLPFEVTTRHGAKVGAALFQKSCLYWGQLLECWPEVRKAARSTGCFPS